MLYHEFTKVNSCPGIAVIDKRLTLKYSYAFDQLDAHITLAWLFC